MPRRQIPAVRTSRPSLTRTSSRNSSAAFAAMRSNGLSTSPPIPARRNEVLALRWSDLDLDKLIVTISRSVEETVKHGRHIKEPKTERGNRTISLDEPLAERLRGYRDQYKRLIAGVPDGVEVNLDLIKLPD